MTTMAAPAQAPEVHIQTVDKVVKVPQVQTQEVVKHVPKVQIQTVEKVVEVPEFHTREVTREVPVPVIQKVEKNCGGATGPNAGGGEACAQSGKAGGGEGG